MKSKNVFWGVILVTIGVLFVLRNVGVLHFSWYSIFSLWPVFLIVLGVSLLPIKSVVRIILAFLIIVLSLVFISKTDYYDNNHYFEPHNWSWWQDDDYNNNNEYDEYENNEWRDQQLFETYNDEINYAVLELDAIAGEFRISETTDYLLKLDREGNFGKYYLNADDEGSVVKLKIDMDSNVDNKFKLQNLANISLNPAPVWDFNIDAGAAKLEFDLRSFKINNLIIDGGASSLNIKLGDKYSNTEMEINSGVAATFIEIPQSSGCKVITNTLLTSKNLDGFDNHGDGVYETENYDDAENKVTIEVDAAISSLKVVRY